MRVRFAIFCALVVLATATTAQAAEPVSVTAARLGELLIDRELRAPAVVISANQATLTSQITALISEVEKDVGDQVQKGELLIGLDDANASLSLAQADASLAEIDAQIVEGKSRLAKAEELLGKDFISDEELISRQSNLAVLEARRRGQIVTIKVAKLELDRTQVRAPFNAAIISRQAQVGSYAQPGTALITIVQTDNIEIDVELDPRYAEHIPQASNFRYTSQGSEWSVELVRMSSVIDISSRVVHARFRFTADSAAIGSSGQLIWSETSGLLPVALIVKRAGRLGVFIDANGSAKFVPVPAAQEGRAAPIDLPHDTLIISRGHARLQDGDALQVTRE